MFVSMTGFGRAVASSPLGKLVVEIQTLNRKYLEVLVSAPKELSRFESELRKWVNEAIGRGQVNVRVNVLADQSGGGLPPIALLRHQKEAWDKLAHAVGCNASEVNLSFLLQTLPAQIELEEQGEVLHSLEACVKSALREVLQMKQREGKVLQEEIQRHLRDLMGLIDEIKNKAPEARKAAQTKLATQIGEAMKQAEIDDRLLQAIISFTERSDISEELARLHSHCLQFQTIQQGRTLDFLVQEMSREVNTIGSKSADSMISHLVINCKSTLEKIREQLQNIE